MPRLSQGPVGLARRPPTAIVLSPLCAAAIAAVCLVRGCTVPSRPPTASANFAFWVVSGMAVGLVVRVAVKEIVIRHWPLAN